MGLGRPTLRNTGGHDPPQSRHSTRLPSFSKGRNTKKKEQGEGNAIIFKPVIII